MAIDLQKLALRRVLETQDNDLYSKYIDDYFSGINAALYQKIKSFYKANTKLPTMSEIIIIRKDPGLQEYLENQICAEDNVCEELTNNFLVEQLQDYYVRNETIGFMDKLIDNLEDLSKEEVLANFETHMTNMNQAIPYDDELFDVAELEFFPDDDSFKIYSSGLSAEHDAVNGGFATQELILLGGRRGSGKSIISLNLALRRFLDGDTVPFFSIEMRYKEVYSRLISMISDVPFLDIFKNNVSPDQKLKIAKARFDTFYKPSDTVANLLADLDEKRNFAEFEKRVKIEKPEFLDNRLFLVDDPSLSINRIDHYCNMFKNKYPQFSMAAVDYLNIIKHEDQKNWQTQIVLADMLKNLARKHDITMLSPYQIDASGEARFAKGILDAADRSFNFFPPPETEERTLENKITVHTTKVRNGRHMSFDVMMDWEHVRIDPNTSNMINEKPHNAAKFGADDPKKGNKYENSRDI